MAGVMEICEGQARCASVQDGMLHSSLSGSSNDLEHRTATMMVPPSSNDNGLLRAIAMSGTRSAEDKKVLQVPLSTVDLSIYRSHQIPFTHTCYLLS